MWTVIALIFVILALNKLATGNLFGFLALFAFAGFAIFLSKQGIDLA